MASKGQTPQKVNKKGTLTARTLEKLGGIFRSGSQPANEELVKSSEPTHGRTKSVPTITGGELDIPEPVGTSKFYLDEAEDMVTLAARPKDGAGGAGQTDGGTDDQRQRTSSMSEKRKIQPAGTFEYTVKDRDTLEKIAAHYDTTPSELKKLNKLISPTIFAGQVLFIPDKDYAHRTVSVSSNEESSTAQSIPDSVFGSPTPKPKMDVPLVKAGNNSPTKVPGHVERQISSTSSQGGDAFDFDVVPHKLSEDEVHQLDQDCMERFIKLRVKHITDGQGVVKGTLLVTPNAVMFDPDVSDPLVMEQGADKFGMIAPMDMIISAAMYHDIAAMSRKGKRTEEVYHDHACPLAKEKLQNSQQTEQSKISSMLPQIPQNIKNIFRNPLNKSESVCSCGVSDRLEGLNSDFTDGNVDHADNVEGSSDQKSTEGRPESSGNIVNDIADLKLGDSSSDKGEGHSESTDKDNGSGNRKGEDVHKCDEASGLDGTGNKLEGNGARVKTSPRLTRGQKKMSVSFSIPDSETISPNRKKDISEELGKVDEAETAVSNLNANLDRETDKQSTDAGQSPNGNSDTSGNEATGNGETRIGSIVYLPVEHDSNGHVSVQSVEKTQDTLSKRSVNEFSSEKLDSELTDINAASLADNPDLERTRTSSTSSLGPFSPTPHLSAFVNYASNLFQRHASDSSIKDIKDVIMPNIFDSVTDSKQADPSRTDSQTGSDTTDGKTHVSDGVDVPVVAAAPTGRRKGKMSRHGDGGQMGVAVESAVSLDEKQDLFNVDYNKFAPRKSIAYPDPPLYLCLRLGTPQNKHIPQHNYSIESYGRRRKKSEYWFSIPREKVDHLYAFFVQWTPEIYGDEDEITPEKRGFVVIDDANEEELDVLDEHFGPNSSFQKDWEIISQSEAIKRRSIVFEEPIPLPDLIGESQILNDWHVGEISQEMPGRTIGYPWTLIYSTDKHGFSLHTLYRDMVNLDCPILIVVKDTSDNVFGALTSCEIRKSDHFYGTGETFLYTFYPKFRVFHWSGDNNFFIKGNKDSLSIGAGQGQFGLWFDEDLYHGRTNCCETFDNDILTVAEDFVVKAFEAWAFIWE